MILNTTSKYNSFRALKFSLLSLYALSTFLVTAAFAQSDADADADGVSLDIDEVIITAQRREQSLLEVPLSVTAFSGDLLERLHITDNKDLEARTPGLQFGLDSPATMRGIGGQLNRNGGDVSVATYSNDLYFDEPYGAVGAFYDMERVEVLRGPQGTLYGRNSVGGAINYINKRPQDEVERGVLAEYGKNNAARLGGYLTGPLGGGFSYRLTGEWSDSDGFQKNISGPDGSTREFWSIAPQLRYKSERWDVNLRYSYFDQDSASDMRVQTKIADPDNEFHLDPITGDPGEDRNQWFMFPFDEPIATRSGDLNNTVDYNRTGRTVAERDAINFHATFTITDNLDITYILGSSDLEFGFPGSDADASPILASAANPYLSSTANRPFIEAFIEPVFKRKIDTHELRLSFESEKFSGILGAYQFDEDLDDNLVIFDTASVGANFTSNPAWENVVEMTFEQFMEFAVGVPPSTCEFATTCFLLEDGLYFMANETPDGEFVNQTSSRSYTSQAVFAQGRYEFSDKIAAVLGVRFTDDEKTTNSFSEKVTVNDLFGITGGAATLPVSLVEFSPAETYQSDKVTGTATLEYTTDAGYLLYGRIATGYRSGGVTAGLPEPFSRYDDEELTSYELGFKARIGDRAQILTTAFAYDFRNYQQIITVLDYSSAQDRPVDRMVIANIPNVDVMGIEIEGSFAATDALTLSGFVALQQSELGTIVTTESRDPNSTFRTVDYIDSVGNPQTAILAEAFDFKGNDLPNAPDLKYSVMADYAFDGLNGEFMLSGSYSYVGERFARISNAPITKLDDYGRFDASLTYFPSDANWQISLFAENLTDEIGIQELENDSYADGFTANATLTEPLYYGVTFQWNMGRTN